MLPLSSRYATRAGQIHRGRSPKLGGPLWLVIWPTKPRLAGELLLLTTCSSDAVALFFRVQAESGDLTIILWMLVDCSVPLVTDIYQCSPHIEGVKENRIVLNKRRGFLPDLIGEEEVSRVCERRYVRHSSKQALGFPIPRSTAGVLLPVQLGRLFVALSGADSRVTVGVIGDTEYPVEPMVAGAGEP